MEEIFEEMINSKTSWLRLDSWVPSQARSYALLRNVPNDIHSYRGYEFLVRHSSGSGVGMGERPPIAEVMILHQFE